MSHYKDGSTVEIGHYVKGDAYGMKDPVQGVVIGIQPKALVCNIQVAYIILTEEMNRPPHKVFKQIEGTVTGCGKDGHGNCKMIGAYLDIANGDAINFERVN